MALVFQRLPWEGKKTGLNPADRAKRGAKRSLLTDANGIPVGLAVDGANRNVMKLVKATLESIPPQVEELRRQVLEETSQNLCLDKGYDFSQVRELVESFGIEAHIRCRWEEEEQKKRSRRSMHGAG